MIRRLTLVPVFLLYLVGVFVLLALAIFTWIATGNNLDDQLEWYAEKGERLLRWVKR